MSEYYLSNINDPIVFLLLPNFKWFLQLMNSHCSSSIKAIHIQILFALYREHLFIYYNRDIFHQYYFLIIVKIKFL